MTIYTTIGGYAVVGAIAGGTYYYYTRPKTRKAAALRASTTTPAEKKKETKKPKAVRKDEKQGPSNKEKPKPEHNPFAEHTVVDNDVEQDAEEINNREFAKQLSSAKTGTLMPAKSQDGAKQRSIKQTRAQERPAVETSSETGTTGADADDDRSSFNSPELDATSMTSTVSNGGVSDMLEKEAPGPAVLRVTAPTSAAAPKKAKAAPKQEEKETKKQRQNRQKKEREQQEREQQEKERKVLLEKQRRTAREAEGRAAKDGSAFMAAKAPATSVWTAPPTITNGDGIKTAETKHADFLDTYDKTSASHETTQSESELAGSDWQKVAASISEEEQTRRAVEDSEEWKTVGNDKKKKKKSKPAPAVEVTQRSEPKPTAPKQEEDEDESSDGAPLQPTREQEYQADLQDSEWEVA